MSGSLGNYKTRSGIGNKSMNVLNNSSPKFTQPENMQMLHDIDKLEWDGEFGQHVNMLKKLSIVKNKKILRESLLEIQRKGNYVCIYPARGSEYYDRFFTQQRPLNIFIQKILLQNKTLEEIKVPEIR